MNREFLERIDAEMRFTREQHADHMREVKEMQRGYRVALNQMIRVVEENSEVIRETRAEMREGRASLRDLREQVQANTRAVLTLLDRFENGGASPATG